MQNAQSQNSKVLLRVKFPGFGQGQPKKYYFGALAGEARTIQFQCFFDIKVWLRAEDTGGGRTHSNNIANNVDRAKTANKDHPNNREIGRVEQTSKLESQSSPSFFLFS